MGVNKDRHGAHDAIEVASTDEFARCSWRG